MCSHGTHTHTQISWVMVGAGRARFWRTPKGAKHSRLKGTRRKCAGRIVRGELCRSSVRGELCRGSVQRKCAGRAVRGELCLGCRAKVERMIAGDVVVLGEVVDHL